MVDRNYLSASKTAETTRQDWPKIKQGTSKLYILYLIIINNRETHLVLTSRVPDTDLDSQSLFKLVHQRMESDRNPT
ncbi:hypothetical protein G9C98_006828 [Cotesia typhae]|uniref:Uncharacterized protein n=1 Tax=Cotesia typhae TaxID=2053667 RepID=A0A8J5QTV4_9HYME|nr:hypothetical protein G9C98_006828 [Cotesia typhae]